MNQLSGNVRPPADMISQAKSELRLEYFDALMKETGGKQPTPAQLVAMVYKQQAGTAV